MKAAQRRACRRPACSTSCRTCLRRHAPCFRIELMSLEGRRAGLALMWMVAWGFIAAICLAAAWLGLMAALAMWAVSLGVPSIVAVIAVAVMNCVAGAVLIYLCIGMSRHLLFSATQRQVAGKSPVKPPVP